MGDFLFARSQMAMSLAFHIVFAALGIGMPLLMAIAEGMYLRTKQPVYLDLCKRWAKGAAILFAVGAVSGTVLSFELGLLWPGFMEQAGAIIGMPFSLEGFAFFTEAIFLGVYLYGWKRVSPLIHWLSGVVVAISGILSGIFVVTANAWMNSPAGFKIIDGKFADIDPIAAMLNPASFHEVVHMTLAAFVATGFMVAAVHAFFLLRDRSNPFHQAALGLALVVACISTPLQILSGDLSARGRPAATGQARGNGSALSDEGRRAAGYRWDSAGPNDDDRLRLEDSSRTESPHRARPERESGRLGGVPPRPMAECPIGALVLRHHGRFGHADARTDTLCGCVMAEVPAFA